jgi:glycosyltransferase involved in cell wall biosynthesis
MKVTVVIPAYNAAKHIVEAVESVLTQTHRDFSLIIVNDGSQDDTLSILNALAAQDPRIRVIDQENQGIAGTLNRALREANTDWVLVMHADDIMLPNRIERQIHFIENNPDIKVFSCLAYYVSERGKQFGKTQSNLFSRDVFHWYVKNNEAIGLLHPGAVLHRETVLALGGYRQEFWPAEDIDLWNRLAEKGHLILVQPEVLMKYRIHTGSASTSRFMFTRMKYEWGRQCMLARRSGGTEPLWEEFTSSWSKLPWFKKLNRNRKIYAKSYYHEAGHDCLRGDYCRAFPKLAMALFFQPAYVLPRLKAQVFTK